MFDVLTKTVTKIDRINWIDFDRIGILPPRMASRACFARPMPRTHLKSAFGRPTPRPIMAATKMANFRQHHQGVALPGLANKSCCEATRYFCCYFSERTPSRVSPSVGNGGRYKLKHVTPLRLIQPPLETRQCGKILRL